MVVSNRNLLFQGPIFRGYLSFRQGKIFQHPELWWDPYFFMDEIMSHVVVDLDAQCTKIPYAMKKHPPQLLYTVLTLQALGDFSAWQPIVIQHIFRLFTWNSLMKKIGNAEALKLEFLFGNVEKVDFLVIWFLPVVLDSQKIPLGNGLESGSLESPQSWDVHVHACKHSCFGGQLSIQCVKDSEIDWDWLVSYSY